MHESPLSPSPAPADTAAPAWLWDADRLRVQWANGAGLALFGAETLFDLIDRLFDATEPGPARIRALRDSLKPGESVVETLHFPSAGQGAEIRARVSLRMLPDGRQGVLVEQLASPVHLPLDPVFEALPQPVLVLDGAGQIIKRNAAAESLGAVANLAELVGGKLGDMAARLDAAGTLSGFTRLTSPYGEREFRYTLRKLAGLAGASLAVLEDVTERRQLERALSQAAPAGTPAKPALPSGKPRLSEDDQRAFAEIARQLKPEVQPKPQATATAGVPQVVRNLFDSTTEPILILRAGQILFANSRAQSEFASPDGSVLGRADLAQALSPMGPGEAGWRFAGKAYHARVSDVAWYGGPARQFVLRALPAEPQPAAAPAATAPAPAPADAELRAILDTASDGIITLDAEGRIGTFSAGAEAMFGLKRQEVMGTAFDALFAEPSRKIVRDYLSALSDQGLASVFNDGREVTALAKPGGSLPVFLTLSRLGSGFSAVLRDITQWKQTEAELRQAKEEAEKASAQKSEFLARISHELRTPLNAILGFSEVMREERFGELGNARYRSYADDIHSSGSHLLSLINDLLDLSKVEAGKLELSFTNVSLANVTQEAMKLMAEQARARRVLLRNALPDDLPQVVADARSMRQILLNLLSNAVKFTEGGGQVIISARLSQSGELALKVADTGPGMSEAELKAALEPFRSLSRDRQGAGTGLGLPLTKALAEANRARFAIASEPGRGTSVEITFPVTRVLAD